ncbi:hypothetical protein QFZ89_007811 [Paraburkholderia youngii]
MSNDKNHQSLLDHRQQRIPRRSYSLCHETRRLIWCCGHASHLSVFDPGDGSQLQVLTLQSSLANDRFYLTGKD